MKIFFILIFFFSFPIFANPLNIDLTQDCKGESCNPRIWYLNDSFDSRFLSIQSPPDNWMQANKFPIWLNKFYSKNESIWTYTLLTFFDVPENISINRQTGIKFGEIGEVFEVYINGNLIVSEGELKDNTIINHRTVRGKIYEFDKSFLKPSQNTLLIKITGDPRYDHTGFYLTKGYKIGLYEDLQIEEQDRITLILIGIYLTIGFYHLFLFTKRIQDKYNLYYALFTIGLGIYIYTRTSAIFEHTWDTTIIQRIELCVLYPVIFFNFALQEEIFFHRIRKITRYYGYFLFSLSIFTIFLPMYIAEIFLRFWQITFITLGLSIAINIIYTSVKNKLHNAKRLMFGIIFLTFSAIFDVIDSLFLNTGLAFSKYVFFLYVFGFATILANNFIQVHNEIEHLNNTLERKVDERTKELSSSLQKVNELKKQQDGDYYLTSLLIDPLGVNKAENDIVNIEFIIKQKKKFSFKGNDSELGGDLCRTETIKLKNRNFTVFFNADAMGKSMQGAGGAIVVGAVFDSIIERTKLSKVVQNSYPERWLKNSFIELHKVFESFDCSMLVSIVVGLVDNASGLIYYINAEHPFPVLYRDGKSSFVGNEFIYRKLGMPVSENANIHVETFQMKQDDVFICGSDGRDDIIITNSLGEKILNTDENTFLKTVEKSKGDLNQILKCLTQDGDLTDDLSLLKITLNRNPFPFEILDLEEILHFNSIDIVNEDNTDLTIDNKDIRLLKIKCLQNVKLSKYEEAVNLGKVYLDLIPADDFMIFKMSETLKKLKQYEYAIELGERLRLRRRQSVNNLINLAECYIYLDQMERGKLILNDALNLDRNNIWALEILERISV